MLRYCKDTETCYFEYFENACSCSSVMIVSPWRKLWCPKCWNQLVGNFDVYLHVKKLTSTLISFLRHCKDIANLLFSELWECLTIIVSTCSKLSCLSACKKINFITHFFLKILQRNSALFILGNLGISGCTNLKW